MRVDQKQKQKQKTIAWTLRDLGNWTNLKTSLNSFSWMTQSLSSLPKLTEVFNLQPISESQTLVAFWGRPCITPQQAGSKWLNTGSHATSLLSCYLLLPRVKCGEAHIFITLQACQSASSEGRVAVCTLHCRELHQGNALRRISRRLGYRCSGSLPLNYLSLVISSKSLAVHS